MRFRLLSRNVSSSDIENCSYNQSNAKEDIPVYFDQVNNEIFPNGRPKNDLETIKEITVWLQDNVKGGPGLSEPSEKALRIMLAGKGGVCSDIAQIFNNFCVINNIKVREWGTTRLPFSSEFGGHSFNEVYCKEIDKWVLIDVYYATMFYLRNKEKNPLSVLETFYAIRKKDEIKSNSFHDVRQIMDSGLLRNYFHEDTAPFLICDYSNKRYDSLLQKTRPLVPVFISHFWLFVLNKSYYYKFPIDNYRRLFSEAS